MKSLSLFAGFITIIYSYGATAEKWKDECVSYYQVQLPDTLEVALYPIDLIINPRKILRGGKTHLLIVICFPLFLLAKIDIKII